MPIYDNPEFTPKEHMLFEAEKEENRLAREHQVRLKELELAIRREEAQARIELKRLESKWSSLLRIPSLIIKLPLLLIASFSLIFYAIRQAEPPKGLLSLFQ